MNDNVIAYIQSLICIVFILIEIVSVNKKKGIIDIIVFFIYSCPLYYFMLYKGYGGAAFTWWLYLLLLTSLHLVMLAFRFIKIIVAKRIIRRNKSNQNGKMVDSPKIEKWIPMQDIVGECSLSRIEYDSNDLLIELDSFCEKRTIAVVFSGVLSYRVTLEHFRWTDFANTPKVSATLIKVENSNYIKWIEESGARQLYDSSLDLAHYMLQLTEHIIDIALLSDSTITLNGVKLVLPNENN